MTVDEDVVRELGWEQLDLSMRKHGSEVGNCVIVHNHPGSKVGNCVIVHNHPREQGWELCHCA